MCVCVCVCWKEEKKLKQRERKKHSSVRARCGGEIGTAENEKDLSLADKGSKLSDGWQGEWEYKHTH